jgi:uncharacterized protein YjbI with pentapeptide repeats
MDAFAYPQKEYYAQSFEGISLEKGQLMSSKFVDCAFINCSFVGAILSECRFANCTFQGCDLSLVQIPGSTFPSTHFEKSKLIGVDWTQADWSIYGLSNIVTFIDCAISHCTFIGLELKNLQVKNCVAIEADFREADLSKADFSGTDLNKSLFGRTDLTGADLSKAKNYRIDPGNNTIKQARFSLPEAMSLLYSMDIILIEQDDPNW